MKAIAVRGLARNGVLVLEIYCEVAPP